MSRMVARVEYGKKIKRGVELIVESVHKRAGCMAFPSEEALLAREKVEEAHLKRFENWTDETRQEVTNSLVNWIETELRNCENKELSQAWEDFSIAYKNKHVTLMVKDPFLKIDHSAESEWFI